MWGSPATTSTWAAASNTGAPVATASSITSAMPASNPAPLITSRSASSIASACWADGSNSCGSAPNGITTSTSASSPTSSPTTCPRMLVVTTIVGRADSADSLPPQPTSAPVAATHQDATQE